MTLRAFFSCLLLSLLLCLALAVSGTQGTAPAEKEFSLASLHSGYALGVRYFLRPEMTQDIFRGRSTQQFRFIPVDGEGYFFIRTVYNRYLDARTAGGELCLVQQERSGADSQKWKILGPPEDCRLLNKQEQRVLAVRSGSLRVDIGIVLAPLSADPAQRWRLWEALPVEPEDYSLASLAASGDRAARLAAFCGSLVTRISTLRTVPGDVAARTTLLSLLQRYGDRMIAGKYMQGFLSLDADDLRQARRIHGEILLLQKRFRDSGAVSGRAQSDPLLDIFVQRMAMGEIRPRVVQKIGVLYVKHLDINQTCPQNRLWIKKLTINPVEISGSIFQQSVLKAIIEIRSRGNLSLQFRRHTPDITMKRLFFRYMPFIMADADLDSIVPDSSHILYDILKNCDTLVTILPSERRMTSGGSGGSRHPVLIQYSSHGPRRLYMNLPAWWGRFSYPGGLLHEYIHTAEAALGRFIALAHGTPEIFSRLRREDPDYPGWKSNDKSELNYLAWHLQHMVPKSGAGKPVDDVNSGWNLFSMSRRYPLALDRVVFDKQRQEALKVSPVNRQLSLEILRQAKQAWGAGNKTLSDSLYGKALALNPACFDAYRHLGYRSEEQGRYAEAVEHMKKYLHFVEDGHCCSRLGTILAVHFKQYSEAFRYYSLGIGYPGNNDWHKAQFCVRAALTLLQAEQYGLARTIALKGTGLDMASKTLECEFLAGESAFKSGDKKAGIEQVSAALKKGLRTNGWYARRLLRWSWGLLVSGNFQDALAVTAAGVLVEETNCRNQSLFHRGESLYRLGQKEEGTRLMRAALQALDGWWQRRFTRVTGVRYP